MILTINFHHWSAKKNISSQISKNFEFDVQNGKRYIINDNNEQLLLSFIIKEITNKYIKIITNIPLSDKNHINFYEKKNIFYIYKDNILKLTTLSMDYGYTFSFTLKGDYDE